MDEDDDDGSEDHEDDGGEVDDVVFDFHNPSPVFLY